VRKDEVGVIRLALVDDQPFVRQALRKRLALEPDLAVVGEASTGREAIHLVEQLAPDLVLMDVTMAEMDGILATAAIHSRYPKVAVIMLSIYDDTFTRTRAHEAGAAAFVNKNGAVEELVEMIRQTVEQRNTPMDSL
jgi:DNA-binding NarL/FixJ family response regulator